MRKSIVISILFSFFILSFSIISCNNNPDTDETTKISPESTKTSESEETTTKPETTENPKPKETDEEKKATFPKLQIINKSQITILRVVLDGYDFTDLNLKQNQSIILNLNNGMPGGYKDVTVSIRYRPYRVTNSAIPPILTKLNFTNGEITSLTIKS